ncbi:MAG: putative NUDIX-like hydrolase [Gemmatimonadetes bacterium]|nr:putative NUDIX-like hydrolase [Gemmatimonadota bacterium]
MAISPYVRGLRTHVGTARLLMPSVAGIVRAGDDRILLVQSRDDHRWTTPGGSIELDDTPANAVVREVWEEAGLLVRPMQVVAIYGGPNFVVHYPNGDETQYISIMFECEVVSGELRADGDETQAARFVSLDEAAGLPLAPWLTDVLPRLFERRAAPWFEPATWRPQHS